MEKQIFTISNKKERFQYIIEGLEFLNHVFHQIQLEIKINKNTLVEVRIYSAKIET